VPDRIVIHIPEKYNNYDILSLPTFSSDKVVIHRPIDYGPATKLLGLVEFDEYNTMVDEDVIIVVDDDRMYNNKLIENMVDHHRRFPNKVLTTVGWSIEIISENKYTHSNKKQPIGIEFKTYGYTDLLAGCCGFLLNKHLVFSLFHCKPVFDLHPSTDYYYVDDIWLSGFLTVCKIDIYIILNSTGRDEPRNINDSIMSLCNVTRHTKNINCIQYFRENYNIWKD